MGTLFNRKHSYCKVCQDKHYATGLCKKHYESVRTGRKENMIVCKVSGCQTNVYTHRKDLLCSRHYVSIVTKERFFRKHGYHKGEAKGFWGYKKYRGYIKHKKNYCEVCGDIKRKLYLHHIDGNKHNYKKSNLKTVCSLCHATIHKILNSLKNRGHAK